MSATHHDDISASAGFPSIETFLAQNEEKADVLLGVQNRAAIYYVKYLTDGIENLVTLEPFSSTDQVEFVLTHNYDEKSGHTYALHAFPIGYTKNWIAHHGRSEIDRSNIVAISHGSFQNPPAALVEVFKYPYAYYFNQQDAVAARKDIAHKYSPAGIREKFRSLSLSDDPGQAKVTILEAIRHYIDVAPATQVLDVLYQDSAVLEHLQLSQSDFIELIFISSYLGRDRNQVHEFMHRNHIDPKTIEFSNEVFVRIIAHSLSLVEVNLDAPRFTKLLFLIAQFGHKLPQPMLLNASAFMALNNFFVKKKISEETHKLFVRLIELATNKLTDGYINKVFNLIGTLMMEQRSEDPVIVNGSSQILLPTLTVLANSAPTSNDAEYDDYICDQFHELIKREPLNGYKLLIDFFKENPNFLIRMQEWNHEISRTILNDCLDAVNAENTAVDECLAQLITMLRIDKLKFKLAEDKPDFTLAKAIQEQFKLGYINHTIYNAIPGIQLEVTKDILKTAFWNFAGKNISFEVLLFIFKTFIKNSVDKRKANARSSQLLDAQFAYTMLLSASPRWLGPDESRSLYSAFSPLMQHLILKSVNLADANNVIKRICAMINNTEGYNMEQAFYQPVIQSYIRFCLQQIQDGKMTPQQLKVSINSTVNELLGALVKSHVNYNTHNHTVTDLLRFLSTLQQKIDPGKKYILDQSIFYDIEAEEPAQESILFTPERADLYLIFKDFSSIVQGPLERIERIKSKLKFVASHLSSEFSTEFQNAVSLIDAVRSQQSNRPVYFEEHPELHTPAAFAAWVLNEMLQHSPYVIADVLIPLQQYIDEDQISERIREFMLSNINSAAYATDISIIDGELHRYCTYLTLNDKKLIYEAILSSDRPALLLKAIFKQSGGLFYEALSIEEEAAMLGVSLVDAKQQYFLLVASERLDHAIGTVTQAHDRIDIDLITDVAIYLQRLVPYDSIPPVARYNFFLKLLTALSHAWHGPRVLDLASQYNQPLHKAIAALLYEEILSDDEKLNLCILFLNDAPEDIKLIFLELIPDSLFPQVCASVTIFDEYAGRQEPVSIFCLHYYTTEQFSSTLARRFRKLPSEEYIEDINRCKIIRDIDAGSFNLANYYASDFASVAKFALYNGVVEQKFSEAADNWENKQRNRGGLFFTRSSQTAPQIDPQKKYAWYITFLRKQKFRYAFTADGSNFIGELLSKHPDMMLAVIMASAKKIISTRTATTKQNAEGVFLSCMLQLCKEVTDATPQNDPKRQAQDAALEYLLKSKDKDAFSLMLERIQLSSPQRTWPSTRELEELIQRIHEYDEAHRPRSRAKR
ncbi:MAG TPA: hypothetical protein VLG38_02215 [Gammaproteobacteria bacterium]|nr:hypothetical protein [Gammaproteobacteria bacterium]